MSEKDQTTPIGSNDNEVPSSGRRQFMTGVASAIGAGVILNAAGSTVAAQTTVEGKEVISFKLSREDLAKIGECRVKYSTFDKMFMDYFTQRRLLIPSNPVFFNPRQI